MSFFSNGSFNDKQAKHEAVSVFIVAALEKHGPLNSKALHYFVSIDPNNSTYLTLSDIIVAIHWCDSTGILFKDKKDFLLKLPSQKGMANVVPLPDDYIKAYYELFNKMKFLKENPDMIGLPDNWVDKLM